MPYNFNEQQPLDNSKTLYGATGSGLASFDETPTSTSDILNNKESKVQALEGKAAEKVNRLAGQQIAKDTLNTSMTYDNTMLQSLTDGDTFRTTDSNTAYRLDGDPKIQGPAGWVDSKEVSHPGWTDPREQEVIPKQAHQMGIDTTGMSYDDVKRAVFKQGELDKLDALYTAMGRPKNPDGTEWTPGPIEYDVEKDPLVLGDKNNPLNIPIQVSQGPGETHNRGVGYLRSADGKHNLTAEQALRGNTFVDYAQVQQQSSKGMSDELFNKLTHKDEHITDDNFLTGVAKGTASTVTSTVGQAIDAVANDLPDWAIGKVEEAYYDNQIANATSPEEKVKLEADKKDAIAHSFKMNGVASYLGGNGYDDTKEYYTNENISQIADKTYGVNTAQAQREQAQIEDDIKKGNYGTAAWHAMNSGNVVGNVFGSVGVFMIGAGEVRAGLMVAKDSSKIAKGYQKAAELLKLGKTEEAARRIEVANKRMNVAQKILAKGIERAGATAMFTSIANDTLASRNEAQGQKHAGMEDIAIAGVSAALQTYVGLESAKILTTPIKQALKESASVLGKKATDKLWQSALKTAGRMTGAVGKGMAVEGTEEYLQQWADILGKQWNTGKKGDDLQNIVANEKNQLDAKVAGIEGLAGGHIAGVTQGVEELSNVTKGLKGKLPKGNKLVEAKVVTDDELQAGREAANNAMSNMPKFHNIIEKVNAPKNAKVKDTMKTVILNGSSDGKPGLNSTIDVLTSHLTTLDSLDSTPEITAEKELVTKHLQDGITLRRKLQGESEVLGNRDPKEIAKAMEVVQTQLANTTDEEVKKEKMKELGRLQAEKIVSDHIHSKDFNGVTVVDSANKNESLALKLLGGEYKGKRKLGMLEHVDTVVNAQSDEARNKAIAAMNKFMSTQAEKVDAFEAAQKEYKEKAEELRTKIRDLEAISKDATGLSKAKSGLTNLKVDVSYPGSKYVYDGEKSEGFTAKLKKELKVLQDLNDVALSTVGALKVLPQQKEESTTVKEEASPKKPELIVPSKPKALTQKQLATWSKLEKMANARITKYNNLVAEFSTIGKIKQAKVYAIKAVDKLNELANNAGKKRKPTGVVKTQSDVENTYDPTRTTEEVAADIKQQNKKQELGTDKFKDHTEEDIAEEERLYAEEQANAAETLKESEQNKSQSTEGKINAKQNEETKVVTEEKSPATGTEQNIGQGNTESTEPKQEELTGIDKDIADLETEIKSLEKVVYEKQNRLDKLVENGGIKSTINTLQNVGKWVGKSIERLNKQVKRIDKEIGKLYTKLGDTVNPKVEAQLYDSIAIETRKLDAAKSKIETKRKDVTEEKKKAVHKILQLQEANKELKATKDKIKEKKSVLVDKVNARDNKVASDMLTWTIDNKFHNSTEAKSVLNTKKGLDATYGKGYLHEFFKASTEPKNLNATALEAIDTALKGEDTLSSISSKNLDEAKTLIASLKSVVQSVVAEDFKPTQANMVWFDQEGVEGFQSVSRMLMSYIVPEGEFANKGKLELNNKVAEALATSSLEVLTDSIAKFDSERRDNNAVRALKGMDKNDPVSQTDRMSIQDFDGIMDYVSSTIGTKAWKALGLTGVKDAPEGIDSKHIEQKMKAELGMLGMLTLEKAGYLRLNAKDRDAELKKEVVFKEGYKTPAAVIYESDKDAGKPDVVTYSLTPKARKVFKAHKGMTTDLERVLEPTEDSLGIYTEENKHEMYNTPTEHQSVSKVAGNVSEPRVKAVKKQSGTKLAIAEDFMAGLDKLDGIADVIAYDEEGKDVPYSLLDKILGKVDPNAVYVNEREGTKGKNDAIGRQKKLLDGVFEATEYGKKPFWQKWRILTNFRFGIVGGKFDHQSILLHRFATDMGKAKVEKGSTEEKILKLAIGQALGVDVDKLPMGKSIDEYAELEAKVRKVFGDAKIPTIQDKEVDSKLNKLVDALGVHDEHGIKGMIEILKYMNYKESNTNVPYESTIMLETDAVTSGYILKMLQMPIFMKGNELDMEKTFKELERGGFMKVKGDHVPKYSEIANDKKKKDAYEKPAELFKQKVEKAKIVNIGVKSETGKDDIKGVRLKPVEYKAVIEKANVGVELKPKKGEIGIQFVDPVLNSRGEAQVHPALVKRGKLTQKDIEKKAKDMLQGMEVAMELLGEGERNGQEYLIETVSRAFMKHPFMVLNYGSGMKGIINSIAKRALSTSGTPYPSKSNLNALMTTMATATKVEEVEGAFDLMKRALKASSYLMVDTDTGKKMYPKEQSKAVDAFLDELRNNIENTPWKTLDLKIPSNFYEMVQEHVARVVGKPIRDTFKEQYGEFIEATRTTNATMALIGKIALVEVDNQIAAETKKKNDGRDTNKQIPLTAKEVDAILKANKTIMPIINMALDNGNGDQMVLFKTAKGDWTEGTMNMAINLQGKMELANGDKLRANSELYKMVVAFTSGAVMPIHAQDASIQAEVLAEWEALGVHDANFATVDKAMGVTKSYNKSAYHLSKDWSLTTEMLDSLYATLNGVDKEVVQKVDDDIAMESTLNVVKKVLTNPVSDIYDMVKGEVPVALDGLSYAEQKEIVVEIGKNQNEVLNAIKTFVSKLNGDLNGAYNEYTNTISEVDMSDNAKIAMISAGRMRDVTYLPTMRTAVKEMEVLQDRAEKGRKVLFETDFSVGHSALDGAEYRAEGKEKYVPKVPKNKLDKSKLPEEMMYEDHSVESNEVVDTTLASRPLQEAKAETNPEMDIIANKILDQLECD